MAVQLLEEALALKRRHTDKRAIATGLLIWPTQEYAKGNPWKVKISFAKLKTSPSTWATKCSSCGCRISAVVMLPIGAHG
jgi:hypothetical protein